MHSLAHLSDDELVAQLQACCRDMRRSKAHFLVFVIEVEERDLHLLAAASSMWNYCTEFLHLSRGSAYRFMTAAKLCKRFPFLLDRIERGQLHITTLAHIASFITDDNVHDLVEETRGMNRTQVDLVLCGWFGVKPKKGADSPMPYDEELLGLVERARELLSHAIPSGDTLEISKAAYTVFIAHLEKAKRAKADKPRPAPTAPTKGISRQATREMFARCGDQCSYVDERTGARCPSRAFIQRDHIHMRADGGSHDPENLRPMCAAHNRLLAELRFGREYVQSRIRFRQRKQKRPKEPADH